jgi:MFS family permease
MFKSINKVIYILVAADFFYNSAFGAFAPVFAIFITGQIRNGSATVAGFATAIYWLVKSVFQLPVARFLDKTDGERDEFLAIFLGYFLSAFVPLGYVFATAPWHLYLLQGFLGFVMAWAVPAWYSTFTRNVDKWRIGFEWSLESVLAVGVATSLSAALGGFIVDHFGFKTLFLLSSLLAFVSSFIVLNLRKYLLPPGFNENKPARVWPERGHQR